MLRRIILENFMSHGRTEIDLADGLTVLTGPNNCGKSAVVAALHILATNGRSKHVLRHGAKFARVTVETDDGHTICWERKKTSVKYTIDGEDIHRVGTSIPDSLHDLLRLDRVVTETGKTKHEYDIHFGEQKSPIFLLGETGSRAASFFASSSDASRLVEMQHLHRLRLRDQRAEAKRLNKEIETGSIRLKQFEPIESISARVASADSVHQTIIDWDVRIERLKKLIRELDEQILKSGRLQETRRTLERLDQTDTNPTSLLQARSASAGLRSRTSQLSDCKQQLSRLSHESKALKPLEPVPQLNEVSRLQRLISHLMQDAAKQHAANTIVAGCSRLCPPPLLQPSIGCQRVLDQIISATKTGRTIERTKRFLVPLRPMPELADTNRIGHLVSNLVAIGRDQRRLNSVKTVFAALTPVSEKVPTARIQQLIDDLARRQNAAVHLKVEADSLSVLEPPPAEIDLSSLKIAIGRILESDAVVETTRKDVEFAKQQLSECEMKIRDFVDSNPKCETCGSSLDPETLMTTVPAIHNRSSISDSSPFGGENPS